MLFERDNTLSLTPRCKHCGEPLTRHHKQPGYCGARCPMPPAPRRPRAPAELLKRYIVQVRTIEPGGTKPSAVLVTLGEFNALTITGAIVQGAQAMARNKIEICEVIATPQD